jgi:hypothetical protein
VLAPWWVPDFRLGSASGPALSSQALPLAASPRQVARAAKGSGL